MLISECVPSIDLTRGLISSLSKIIVFNVSASAELCDAQSAFDKQFKIHKEPLGRIYRIQRDICFHEHNEDVFIKMLTLQNP